MIKFWLALLLAFFRPGMAEGEADVDVDQVAEEETESVDDSADDAGDDLAADDAGDAGKSAAQAEAERRAADDRARVDRIERENVELRARLQPRSDAGEDEENRKLADPNTPPLEKWQIQANRELKAGRSTAQAALLQAQDVNDRTSFAGIALTDPTAKKYETRVEKELADMRAKGQNAPREAIYTYLLGKDMREGKFKKKAAVPAKPGADTSAVNRGRLPGARSDVRSGAGNLSNRDKLAKKLDGVQI